MIVFSDLHLDEDSADTVLGEILPGIFQASQDLGDPLIACLGDFWHLRYKVDVRLQNAVRDELQRWIRSGAYFLFLPGNHDQINVHGRNALEVFDQLGPECYVFTQPGWTAQGLWIPYRKYPKDIMAALALPRPDGDCDNVLWGHFGVQGFWMNDFVQDTDSLPISIFREFYAVILGHYHKRQQIDDVSYVGSPRQVTAHESGQDKGFAIWDGENLKYITAHWGKQFHRIRLEPGQILDTESFHPGDDVRVSVAVGVDPSVVGDKLTALGVQHVVTPDAQAVEQRLSVKVGADLTEYAEAYVDLRLEQGAELPGTLSKDRLMTLFREWQK